MADAGERRHHQHLPLSCRNKNSMPAPDVFVVTREEWVTACQIEEYLAKPPLLVAEVISPANRKRRVEEKVGLYLDQGVQQVWVVTPKKQTITVHHASTPDGVEARGAIKLPPALTGTLSTDTIFRLDL